MNIQEATKQAMAQGLAITRRTGRQDSVWTQVAVLPTNTRDCYIIVQLNALRAKKLNIHLSRRWNPYAEDILADDWDVTDYMKSEDLTEVIR